MAMISLRQLLDHAAEHGYGVPAFNVNNLEQIQAIMQAAEATASPVILQASAGARKYAGEPFLRKMVEAAAEMYPDLPIVLHQDHGASPAVCIQAIRSGFTSVMMDGSLREDAKTPASYEYNVDVTRQVVQMAHTVGVSIKSELGCLGSLESGQAGEEETIVVRGPLRSNNLSAVLAACRDGMGLAVLPYYVAGESVKEARLVPLLGDYKLPSQQVHAVFPSPRLVPAKVTAFIGWLQRQLAGDWWHRPLDTAGPRAGH